MRTLIALTVAVYALAAATCSTSADSGCNALPALSRSDAWQAPADGVSVGVVPGDFLTLTVAGLKENDTRVVKLAAPVPLGSADAFNYWDCFPVTWDGFGVALTPLFEDKNGKAVDVGHTDFLDCHIGAPNSRRCGIWAYDTWTRGTSAVVFTGFSVHVTYVQNPASTKPHTIYLKGFALEHTDYQTVPLYYMVGNYRENFCDTSFDNDRASTLTNENTGDLTPFVRLDNLIDQARDGRPGRVDVHYYVYDMHDTLIFSGSAKAWYVSSKRSNLR